VSTTHLQHRALKLAQWIALGAGVGVVCGAGSALFLWLLEEVTRYRETHDEIVFALPIVGVGIGLFYERFGTPIRGGNNLVIDTIHDGGPEIPLRMAPMVMVGTLLTHLFGGSAGREGTAVQMGASFADAIAHRLKVEPETRRLMLAAGVAGGFGSVFGTPIAGTIFGLEFVVLGSIEYHALVPALTAAIVGDAVTRGLGIVHTSYPIVAPLALSPSILVRWVVFALAVAAVTTAFVELTHALKRILEARFPRLPLRMFASGVAVVVLWQAIGDDTYLGLGVPTIVRAFGDPSLPQYAFALKLVLTAVTLGAGYLGGEVTPLFFVGATLGSTLARWLDLPLDLAAGVGMAAVFAVASNAPLALSVMAVELLGASVLPHVVIVSAIAYVLAGHRGIYPSQRLVRAKSGGPPIAPRTIRDHHD